MKHDPNAYHPYRGEDTSYVPGADSITWTIDVINPGYFPASVDVSDVFPEGTSNCNWTCAPEPLFFEDGKVRGVQASCTPAVSGDIADMSLPLSGGWKLRYQATCSLDSDAPQDEFVNTAEVTSTGVIDPVAEDNVDWWFSSIAPQIDAELLAVDFPTAVEPGQIIAVHLEISNDGPSDAFEVEVQMDLDLDGVALESASCATRTDVTTLCALPSVPAGTSEIIDLVLSVSDPQDTEVTLAISAVSSSGEVSDPDSIEVLILEGLVFAHNFEPGNLSQWSSAVGEN